MKVHCTSIQYMQQLQTMIPGMVAFILAKIILMVTIILSSLAKALEIKEGPGLSS